jgi:hypothetical protein
LKARRQQGLEDLLITSEVFYDLLLIVNIAQLLWLVFFFCCLLHKKAVATTINKKAATAQPTAIATLLVFDPAQFQETKLAM